MPTSNDRQRNDPGLGLALRIVDDGWEEVRSSLFVQRQLGISPSRLPEVSLGESQRRSEVGLNLLRRLDALDTSALPHELALTLRLVRFRAQTWSREADWYWTVVDPMGVGFFGLFLPTAYCGGYLLSLVHDHLAAFSFKNSGDADRYLALLADYARLINQFVERTAGQAERGMRMPKVQVPQARTLLRQFQSGILEIIGATPKRVGATGGAYFVRELECRVDASVRPAFDRALVGLSDDYLEHAPDGVGLGQYAAGPEIYAELAKFHTTLDITAEQLHARGHARMAKIQKQKTEVRAELGFEGDDTAFIARLNQDRRWRTDTIEGVMRVFHRYIDRLKPLFSHYFSESFKASYDVAPLAEALQGSMTYGYFDPPRQDHGEGLYLFNAANLTKRGLFILGALTYHELVPGHHLHLATQQENDALHPLRQYSLITAYNEGWAEYAATLAGEIGMYEEPEERYGRLIMDAFFTTRLVVDTGMNALGWSLERARDYMRQYSGMSEGEILTESVRYSCDIPGQALAYKAGDAEILALRERMRRALGEHFDLKCFHSAVLGPGALPMPVLGWHVDYEIRNLLLRPGVRQTIAAADTGNDNGAKRAPSNDSAYR
jgi:uncharacterized protein (DUF885 family)